MSAEQEKGGVEPTDDECRAVLSIFFADGVGDAVRAYGDLRAAQAIAAAESPPEVLA